MKFKKKFTRAISSNCNEAVLKLYKMTISLMSYYVLFCFEFLDTNLLSNLIDVTDSLTGRLALSAIYLLFVDLFGYSLRLCQLELKKKAISDGFMSHFSVF